MPEDPLVPDPSAQPPDSIDELLEFAFRDRAPAPAAPPAPDAAPEAAFPDLGTARYRITAELGQGGMGRVLAALDRDLGREVAIKVLQGDRRLDQGALRRFLEEAEVTSQLQHPGIVPVYDLGIAPGGSPFLVMKRIRGRTLAAELRGLTDRDAARHRLLLVFAQVCQAVAYAHARGVLHRDLKPSNVMLGEFGEVQVMDWGLAKVLASRRADAAATAVAPTVLEPLRLRAGDSPRSTPGSALGTPAFMAPEQARGEGAVDARTDVFALGGILCEILTGAPPFVATTAAAQRELAARGDLAPAHARVRAATRDEPALGELAVACLASGPGQRPTDAGAVHAALAAWLSAVAERTRAAELAAATAQAQARAQRRAKRLAWLLALVVVIAGSIWLRFEQERQARAAVTVRTVEQALAEAQAADAAASPEDEVRRAEGVLAAVERAAAAAQVGVADPGVRERVATARREAAARSERAVARLQQERDLRALEERLDFLDSGSTAFSEAEDYYRQLLTPLGIDPTARPAVAPLIARLATHRLRSALVTACLGWSDCFSDTDSRCAWLKSLAEGLEPSPTRRSIRQASDRKDVRQLLALIAAARDDLDVIPLLAGRLSTLGQADEAEHLLRNALRAHPDHWHLHLLLGAILADAPEPGPAMEHLRAALALRPQSGKVRVAIVAHLFRIGQDAEALAELDLRRRESPELDAQYLDMVLQRCNKHWAPERVRATIAALHRVLPPTCRSWQRLAFSCRDSGEPDAGVKAVTAFRQALAAHKEKEYRHMHLSQLAHALLTIGRHAEAAERFAEASQEAPDVAEYAYNRLVALDEAGDAAVASAAKDFERRFPADADGQLLLAQMAMFHGREADAEGRLRALVVAQPGCTLAWQFLGNLLRRGGNPVAACDAYGHALEGGRPARSARYGRALCRLELGDRLGALADLGLAALLPLDPEWEELAREEASLALRQHEHLRRALALIRPVAARRVSSCRLALDLAAAMDGDEGAARLAAAMVRTQATNPVSGFATLEFFASHSRPDLVVQVARLVLAANATTDVAYRWVERAILDRAPGDRERLFQLLRERLPLDPDNGVLQEHLAMAAFNAGDMAMAADLEARLLAVRPGDADHIMMRFVALLQLGDVDHARAMLDRVRTLRTDSASRASLMANALVDLGEIRAALDTLRSVSKRHPTIDAQIAQLADLEASGPAVAGAVAHAPAQTFKDTWTALRWLAIHGDRSGVLAILQRDEDRLGGIGVMGALTLVPAIASLAGLGADGARARRWVFEAIDSMLDHDGVYPGGTSRQFCARRMLGDLRLRPLQDPRVLERLSLREREAWESLWARLRAHLSD